MTVIFRSGMLAGREFDAGYKHPGYFQIQPQTFDGITMPGGNDPAHPTFLPAAGDTYAVYHIAVPQGYIDTAETELLKAAVQYLYENEDPRFTVSGTLDSQFARAD